MQQNFIQSVDLSYTDAELLAYIEKKDQQLQTEAVELGKQDAFKEKPKQLESLLAYREPIYRGYNLLGSEVHQRLQAGIQLRFGKLDIDETKVANQKLLLVIDQLKANLKSNNSSEMSFPFGVLIQVVIASIITLALWLGEQEFIVKSLGLIGGGMLSNRILALAISTGIMVLGHYAKQWTDGIQNRKLKLIARGGIIALITIIFIGLGILRQRYFTNAELQLPLWVFVSLNVLFFLGFYLIAIYVLMPAVEKLKNAMEDIKKSREIYQLRKQIKETENQIEANTQKLNSNNRLRLAFLSFAKATQELIQRKYERAMSKYLQANLSTRETPYTSSHNDLPKLESYYEDINV